MADFDLEQLKTIIENLGDRLERTKGDQLSRDELYRIRMILNKMSGSIGKGDSSTQDRKTIISELVKEMRKGAPRPGPNPVQSPTTKRNTIITEEKTRRQGDRDGNTILDQILRKAGSEANEFSDAVDTAGKNTKTFGERLAAANSSFGAVASSASAFVAKSFSVGAERIDFYRQLMATGEGSVMSMQDMGRQASAAGMTVKQFVEAMSNGTQGARQLGAIKFGDVRKSLVEMTRASGYMGMLPDQITEVTSTYAEILRLQGAGQNRSSEQMAAGILNLVKTSETTAHILGKTREEALEAQKLAAADYQFNAVADSKGFDAQTANAVRDIFKNNFGDVGVQAITDQLTYGQVVNKPAAELAAVNPDLQKALSLAESMLSRGASSDQVQIEVARALKENGANLAKNKDLQLQFAQQAGLDNNPLSGALKSVLQNRFVSQSNNTDYDFNRASDQNQNDEQRAGVGALQLAESFNKAMVTIDSGVTAVFNPMVDMMGPKLRDDILPNMDAFNVKLQELAMSASLQTNTMGSIGVAAIGVAGGLAIFSGALTAAAGGLKVFRGIGSFLGSGARGAGGAVGGAGRLAGGAGRLAGLARVAAPALGLAGGVAAGVGGMYLSGEQIQSRRGESFTGTGANEKGFFGSRSTSYLTSILSGAGTGALVGGIPGAVLGGITGLGGAIYNDWDNLTGSDASQSPMSARAGSNVPQSKPRNVAAPADATGQRSRTSLTVDQMTNRIMEATERSTGILKQIKDNSDRHLEAVREEIAVIRNMSDRMDRLLQEGNKNTKSIAEHSF